VLSRKAIASIVIGVAAVLIMTWRMTNFPARVVVINQSGMALMRVALDTGGTRFELGNLNNGETRRISVAPTETLRLSFHTATPHIWSSPEPLTAGQSLVLYVTPDQNVMPRSRIGTLVR
jgi:hypothetical protein